MAESALFKRFLSQLGKKPHAVARISDNGGQRGEIRGTMYFYQTKRGVLVAAEVCGLPSGRECGGSGIFALHIHSGAHCSGNEADPFADALAHYDPDDCPHPYHGGDLPPLFSNGGYAFMVVLTDRFSVREILHKTVIIHAGPDDFSTQPSGNAGKKIACGQIKGCGRY